MFIRDPRFSDETLRFLQLAAQSATSQSKTIELDSMRQLIEQLNEKGNAQLIGTSKGNLEEQVVKTNSAGRFFF